MTKKPGAIGHVGTILCGHGAFGIYYFYGACGHSHASIHVDTFGCGWSNTGLHRNIGTCAQYCTVMLWTRKPMRKCYAL